MKLITIESKYDLLSAHEGRLVGSRLMWVAKGFEVWVKGPLPGLLYEQACNLAMSLGEGVGVKPSEIRRAGGTPYKLSRGSDTKSKRMF